MAVDLATLQEALDCGIINMDTLQQQVEMTKKENFLKSHPYALTRLPNGRWQSYVRLPDTGKRKEIRAPS